MASVYVLIKSSTCSLKMWILFQFITHYRVICYIPGGSYWQGSTTVNRIVAGSSPAPGANNYGGQSLIGKAYVCDTERYRFEPDWSPLIF